MELTGRLPRQNGFTLIEALVTIALCGLIALLGMLVFSPLKEVRGLQAATDLRKVWHAQRLAVVNSMAHPATAADPATFAVEFLLGDDVDLPSLKNGTDTINAAVSPPTHSADGQHGDEAKTSATTGDGLYDVGPEY